MTIKLSRVLLCAASLSAHSCPFCLASGNSWNGIKRLEVWVDGNKLAQALDDQINTRVSVAAGTHNVTFVAVDLYDTLVKKTTTVTVS